MEGSMEGGHELDDMSVGNEPLLVSNIAPDRKRWIVLFILWATMVQMNISWVTFSPVADIAACYYGVNINWIDVLSGVTMAVFIIGFVPGTWYLNRFGLKVTAVSSSILLCIAGWLRVAAEIAALSVIRTP